ncbi:hypothetical protein EBU71_14215 [bacterium]|nr:hypothetical protein [Candidatus Elulimicrobium humile]
MVRNIEDLESLAGYDEYGHFTYQVWIDDKVVENLEDCDPDEGWIRLRIKKFRSSDDYFVGSKKWGRVAIVKVYK